MATMAAVLSDQIEHLARFFDELRLKRHLLGQEGRDLLEKLERRLTKTEHKLRRGGTRRKEIAQVIHELHEAVGHLRERAGAKGGTDNLPESPSSDDDL